MFQNKKLTQNHSEDTSLSGFFIGRKKLAKKRLHCAQKYDIILLNKQTKGMVFLMKKFLSVTLSVMLATSPNLNSSKTAEAALSPETVSVLKQLLFTNSATNNSTKTKTDLSLEQLTLLKQLYAEKGNLPLIGTLQNRNVFEPFSSFLTNNPLVKYVTGVNLALSSITGIFFTSHSWYNFAKNFCQRIKLKFAKVNPNVDEVIMSFDKELSCLKGQDAAKLKMKEVVAAIIDARNEAKENKKPYGKGDVIYMIGPSGVGKTFSSQCLAKAVMGENVEPLQVDSSCFETDSKLSKKSQLLYMRTNKGNNSDMRYYMDTSLAAKIASNPKSLLIFDEYDKWCTPETDEFLRTIIDKGVIYRDGEKIDCSELLVIVISNEDHASLTAGNTERQNAPGNVPAIQDDGTGSRTHVVHDKSFLNRLNVIEFENLNVDAYEEIAQNKLDVLVKRFNEKYSLNLDLGDTARKIAIKTSRTNQGAREIDKILAKLRTAIITERERSEKISKSKFNVRYDCDNDRFILTKDTDSTKKLAETLTENTKKEPKQPAETLETKKESNSENANENATSNTEKLTTEENLVEEVRLAEEADSCESSECICDENNIGNRVAVEKFASRENTSTEAEPIEKVTTVKDVEFCKNSECIFDENDIGNRVAIEEKSSNERKSAQNIEMAR